MLHRNVYREPDLVDGLAQWPKALMNVHIIVLPLHMKLPALCSFISNERHTSLSVADWTDVRLDRGPQDSLTYSFGGLPRTMFRFLFRLVWS